MLAIQLISNAKNMDPDFRYLDIRLRLEQQRLYSWSSEIGLLRYLEGNEDTSNHDVMGTNRSTILDTLLQIQVLAVNFIKCRGKFGDLIPDDGCPEDMEAPAEDMNEKSISHFPDVMHFLKNQRHSVPSMHGLPKRLKWAAFYKGKYEKLINRLRELNDVLIDLANCNARIAIRQSTKETNMTVLHLHSKIDELVQLIKALLPDSATGLSTSSKAASQYDSSLNTQQKCELAGLAYFKVINTSVENDTYFNPLCPVIEGRELKDIKLARSDIHLMPARSNVCDRCEADYQPVGTFKKRVWIEWREYDPIVRAESSLAINHPSRIDKLVALLSNPQKPDLLRVPHCLGYFDDARSKENDYRKGRLGFVFQKPTTTALSPVSLRQLLEMQIKPLLTDRIILAKAISNCLMCLHSVNWLHKGLRSHNIVFFPEETKTVDYSCPFLSGFGYARPAFRADMTEVPSDHPEFDMYRHPRTHGLGPWEGRQGFKRTFDIYSLGIMLIEIANWESIDKVLMMGEPSTVDAAALAEIQSRLLNEDAYLNSVGSNAGSKYRDATTTCLIGATAFDIGVLDDETNSQVAAKLSRNFYHRVLGPLEDIVI